MKKSVLFLVTRSFNAARSRKPLIKLLIDDGCDVTVLAKSEIDYDDEVRRIGARFINIHFYRHGLSFIQDLKVVFEIRNLVKEQKPNLVHAFNPKPVLAAGFSSYLVKMERFCVTLTGLGAISEKGVLSSIIKFAYKVALRNADLVILENKHDLEFVLRYGITQPSKCRVQIASGVDVSKYNLVETNKLKEGDVIKFAFASRLVWNKGVRELLIVAKKMKAEFDSRVEFIIAGDIEEDHPNGVPLSIIKSFDDAGIIRYIGRLPAKEIPFFLQDSHVVILPSYREGFSKSLMEGAAAGKALISTNVPGCREIVEHGVNGLLVKPRDEDALYKACEILMRSPNKINSFGKYSRKKALHEFDINVTAPRTMDCYKEIGF